MSFESELDELFDHWEDLDIEEIKNEIMRIYYEDRNKAGQACYQAEIKNAEFAEKGELIL